MSYDFKGNNAALASSIHALLALDAKGALATHGIGEMARQLLEASASRLTEQHQGEPAAWFTDDHLTDKSATTWDRDTAERWRAKGWPVSQLYTHADPGEVEALRGAYLRAGEREHELRTELATWKRRAIEAESKLRTYDPQVVELGEEAMQALLAEPKPKELVLTKCKLCDQLQADLTKLDEKLDQTQDLLRYMVYDYRSVVQAGYDRITALGSDCDSVAKMLDDNPNYQKALALLLPDLESRPEERGTPETEPCSGCGTPGWTVACNKCVPY